MFNIAIALLLMELGIYQSIEHTLVVYSAVAAAWVGALVAGLVINKLHGLSPRHIEFKRAHLYDVNPVGTGAMMLAVAAGILTYAGDVRPQLGGLLPFHRLWFGIPAGAPDRVENGWALLSGAQTAGALGETRHH